MITIVLVLVAAWVLVASISALGLGRVARREHLGGRDPRSFVPELVTPSAPGDMAVLTERGLQESLDIVLGTYTLEYRWNALGEAQRQELITRIRNQAEFVNGVLHDLTTSG